jgi:hypothetical protein
MSKSKNIYAEMVAFFNELNINADKIEYTLNFNDSEAYFFISPLLVGKKKIIIFWQFRKEECFSFIKKTKQKNTLNLLIQIEQENKS